jgi:histidinol-phosphatase (PHP family)
MNTHAPVLCDYHIHTPYCGHAQGTIVEYIENAIEKGLKEICFTDRLGRYYLNESQKKRYWDWGMNTEKLGRYCRELEDVADTFKDRITIRSGLEIDYIEGAEDLVGPVLDGYPFDFLLGSIHCLPAFGWKHIANYSVQDQGILYDEYFKAAKNAIKSGLFNALAHLDFIWRYTRWPEKKTTRIFTLIEQTIQEAAHHNVAIELNSNGYLWSQIYTVLGGDPFQTMLDAIKTYSAPLTVGSDAHKPEFIGKAFREIAFLLKNTGIPGYCTFEKKRCVSHSLV